MKPKPNYYYYYHYCCSFRGYIVTTSTGKFHVIYLLEVLLKSLFRQRLRSIPLSVLCTRCIAHSSKSLKRILFMLFKFLNPLISSSHKPSLQNIWIKQSEFNSISCNNWAFASFELVLYILIWYSFQLFLFLCCTLTEQRSKFTLTKAQR